MEKSCLMFFFLSCSRASFSRVAVGIPEDFPVAVPLHSSRGATGSSAEFRVSEGKSWGRVGRVDSRFKGVVVEDSRTSPDAGPC